MKASNTLCIDRSLQITELRQKLTWIEQLVQELQAGEGGTVRLATYPGERFGNSDQSARKNHLMSHLKKKSKQNMNLINEGNENAFVALLTRPIY